MFGLGIMEILIIVLAAGLLLFGSKKIVELARSLGRFSGEFKKGRSEVEKELRTAENEAARKEESPEKKKRDA